MADKPIDDLRRKLGAGKPLDILDTLAPEQAQLLSRSLDTAMQRDHRALDQAIEQSLSMVPLLLRPAFKKVLFP